MPYLFISALLFIFSLVPLGARAAISNRIPVGIDSGALLNLNIKVLIAARPLSIILVEKDFQRLRVLRYDGRLQVMTEYSAATGENFGPKVVEGDKKTPEGIYFITKKYIDKKLTVFGTKAFHLNYPNIFDRLEKRDGHGIFIHGTNKKLRYDSTNGCISLNNNDLSQLARFLKIGTIPVIIIPSLLDLKAGQASLPDLSSNNFELAKKLLLPEAADAPITFYNLYMIQVNRQTLVACEYGLPNRKSSFAASYIGFKSGKGWKIMQRLRPPISRIPTITQEKGSRSAKRPSTTAAKSNFPALSLWPLRKRDVYLNWYREANRALKLPAPGKEIKSVQKQKPPLAQKRSLAPYRGPAPSMPKLVFIILLLSAILIILSYIIIRLRGLEKKSLTVKLDNKEVHLYSSATEQQDTLINDVKVLKNDLNALDIFLKETVMNKEEFRVRINDLETRLTDRQAEIEQLITEKAALKLKGMSGLSKQVEELGEMRQELRIAQEKLDESRQDLERLPALEAMLADQQEKYQQLALKYAALKQEDAEDNVGLREELTAQHEKADDLREQLQASLAAQDALQEQLQEQKAEQENEDNLQIRNQSLEAELKNSHRECRRLQDEITLLSREEAIDNEQKMEITRLSSQLEDIRQQNHQLNEQITTLTELKAELYTAQEEQQNIAAMRQELAALREKLQASQAEEQGLRQEITTISSHTRRVKELEELLLARQIEVTSQNNKIEEIHAEHQQELSGLSHQLEELRQALKDERTRCAEDESRLHELEEELTAGQQTVEIVPIEAETEEAPRPATAEEETTESGDQPAATPKPPAETKKPSSPLLPEDILNKWLDS